MTESANRSTGGRILLALLTIYGLGLLLYWVLYLTVGDAWDGLALLHNGAPYLFALAGVGLVLAFVLAARRVLVLYVLLSLAGFLWFGVPLLPRTAPVVEGTEIDVITFNVYPENDNLEAVDDWLLAMDADIVVLQEVNGDLPQIDAAYPHQHEIESEETGNRHRVLSRYPIEGAGQFLLGDVLHQRVVLDVGVPLALYNVHLAMPFDQTSDAPLLLRYDESRRNQQISELVQLIAVEPEARFIVAGDFNMSEFSPIYDTLAVRLQDAWRVAAWGIGATYPAGAGEELPDIFPRLLRLDYVWYSGDGLQAVAAGVGGLETGLGSDHLPVKVEFNLLPQ